MSRSTGPSGGVSQPVPLSEWIESAISPRRLILLCGLPASGKSATARMIRKRRGFEVVSTDLIRWEALGDKNLTDPRVASDLGGRLLVYEELFRRAKELGSSSKGIVLDGTFILQSLRRRAAQLARELSLGMTIIETRCEEDVALRRIAQRSPTPGESNALTAEAYFNNKAAFEPIDVDELRRLLEPYHLEYAVVDTTGDKPEHWRVSMASL